MRIKKFAAMLLAGVIGVCALTGCGINKNEVIATYGDKEVTLGIANFMCRFQQAQYHDTFVALLGEDCWKTDPYGTGSTMEDSVKTNVMLTLHDLYVLRDHADEYHVALSEDEKAAIEKAVDAFIKNNSKQALDEMGADRDIVIELMTLYTIQGKMREAIIEGADTKVSDEDANMRAYSMLRVSVSGYYDSDNKYVSYSDDEKDELKKKLEDLVKEIEDPKNFEDVAKKHEYSVTTGTYAKDNTSLNKDVKSVLDKLKAGELSELITTDTYLYVVRLDSEHDEKATEENRKQIISERQEKFYEDTLDAWEKDDKWTVKTKVLARIKFDDNLTQSTGSSESESSSASESESSSATESESESETGSESESGSESETTSETESESATESESSELPSVG